MDELSKEIRALCDYLIGDDPIRFNYENDAPDTWECILCLAAIPVVYIRPTRESPPIEWSFPRSELPDIRAFPHEDECPVRKARHILELLGK